MCRRSPASFRISHPKMRASSPAPASPLTAGTSPRREEQEWKERRRMARPREFNQDIALRKAIRLFSRQGFAATSTDELMRGMDVGRQSMYDTFGDKRALFLKALEIYVTESVHAINVELRAPGSPLAAIRSALVHFSERKDLSSTDGCMGINAICEFGMRDEDVTRITRRAANAQRLTLMDTLRRAQMEG